MPHVATPRPAALLGPGLAAALVAFAHALRRAALAADAWLAHRARAADDQALLAAMSERELHDIGIAPGYRRDVAASAWTRDTP